MLAHAWQTQGSGFLRSNSLSPSCFRRDFIETTTIQNALRPQANAIYPDCRHYLRSTFIRIGSAQRGLYLTHTPADVFSCETVRRVVQ